MRNTPTHLKEILKTVDGTSGQIICTCGGRDFAVKYCGEPRGGMVGFKKCGSGYALVVDALCDGCGRSWELFDHAKHSYNGLICGEGVTAPADMTRLCPECGGSLFEIEMSVEIEDEQQFIEEVVEMPPAGMSFVPEDHIDVWDWVVIDLKCSGCGKTIESWVNAELS